MLRIIVRDDDATMPANVTGGSAKTTFRTFDVEAPEVEQWLAEPKGAWHRYVVGVEVVTAHHEPEGRD